MVFRKYERNYDAEVVTSFGESMSGAIELPRDRRIEELVLDCRVRLANSNTAEQTMTKRQLYSIFDNITLKVNGAVGNVSVEGGRYYDMVKFLTGREPLVINANEPLAEGGTISVAGSSTADVRFYIPFFFKRDIGNPYDVSSYLDAFNLSSLRLEFSTRSGWLPAETDITITESNSDVRAWLKEVYIDPETLLTVNESNGYGNIFSNVYYTQTQDKTLSTSAGLANSVDVEVGYIHQQVVFHTYDASAADWANDLISQYRIQENTGGVGDIYYTDSSFEASQAEDVRSVGLHVQPKGATVWDAETKMGGLDTRRMKNGDLKFNYTTGSTLSSGNDLLDVMYKSYLPVVQE